MLVKPPPKGICRWCDGPCDPKRQWHPACVVEFKIVAWPSEARLATWNRDKGICARCRKDSCANLRVYLADKGRFQQAIDNYVSRQSGDLWQHDHIRPLVEARGDLSFWRLDNIQTLCTPCHKQKGREDHARRRQERIGPMTLL